MVVGGVSPGSISPSPSGSTPQPATPSPPPTLQSLLLVPLYTSLTSDPANATSPHATPINLLAQMSDGRQIPTTATWSAVPAGELAFRSNGFADVVAGAPTALVTIAAATGGVTATVSVQVKGPAQAGG